MDSVGVEAIKILKWKNFIQVWTWVAGMRYWSDTCYTTVLPDKHGCSWAYITLSLLDRGIYLFSSMIFSIKCVNYQKRCYPYIHILTYRQPHNPLVSQEIFTPTTEFHLSRFSGGHQIMTQHWHRPKDRFIFIYSYICLYLCVYLYFILFFLPI